MSEKIKIILEAERKIVITEQPSRFAQSWCEKCRKEVAVVKLQMQTLSGAQSQSLKILISDDIFHLIETGNDELITLCLNSLLSLFQKKE